jgi:hypothetical protein
MIYFRYHSLLKKRDYELVLIFFVRVKSFRKESRIFRQFYKMLLKSDLIFNF